MSHLDDVAVTPPPSQVRAGSFGLRRLAGVAGPAACYLLLACVAFWPTAPLDTQHLAGCACGDPEQQTWFLAWTSFSLTHGQNPFFTTYLNVPTGANLAIATSMPLLGTLGLPVTLLAGPIATYNLLLRLGLAASGISMFLVLRRYVSWWPAAFGGGLLFAFSPYMVGQAHRHIFLIFLPLLPLLIPLLDDWLIGLRRTPLRSGLLVGLVAGLQYLISAEILLTSAMLTAIGLLFLAIKYHAVAWQRLGVLARGLAAAVPVFALLAGYPIWMLLAGPNRPVGPPHPVADLNRYQGDLLAPLVPTANQLLAPDRLTRIGDHLVAGSLNENGFYLGIPLVVLLCYLTVRYWRTGIVAVFAVVGAAAFVLSLGPKLTAHGRVLFAPMPFALLAHLPVLQDLEAARFSLFMQLAAAVILGVGLDRVRASAGSSRSFIAAAAGMVALIPLIPSVPFRSANASPPAFFTSQAVRLVPAGAVALTFPFDWTPRNRPMVWQAVSGMRFRILGGDVFVPGPGGRSTLQPRPPGPPAISAVLLAGVTHEKRPPFGGAQTIAAFRLMCARSHIGVVLVDPAARDGHAVARLVGAALRTPPVMSGQMDVWPTVQRDLRPNPA